jgi:hypothetical protein
MLISRRASYGSRDSSRMGNANGERLQEHTARYPSATIWCPSYVLTSRTRPVSARLGETAGIKPALCSAQRTAHRSTPRTSGDSSLLCSGVMGLLRHAKPAAQQGSRAVASGRQSARTATVTSRSPYSASTTCAIPTLPWQSMRASISSPSRAVWATRASRRASRCSSTHAISRSVSA